MTGFKTYFAAHVRSNLRPLLYILIITLTLSLMLGLTGQPYEVWDHATVFLPFTIQVQKCIGSEAFSLEEKQFF